MSSHEPGTIRLGATGGQVPSGLWPGSSPEVIAAHERALALVGPEGQGELPSTRTSLGAVLAYGLALLATCLAIGRGLDALPGIRLFGEEGAQAKYAYFAKEKDRFEAVFIGSSQVYRHVLPALFDRRLARHGHRIRSFNFGMPGMQFPETLYAVDFVLDQEPRRLDWVFIELKRLEPNVQEVNRLSRREIHWHSARVFPWLVVSTLASDAPLSERLHELWWHTQHFLYRLGNVAMALPVVETLLGLHTFTPLSAYTQEGALPIDVEVQFRPDLMVRRQAFLDDPEELDERLAELRESPAEDRLAPQEEELLRALVERVRAAGAEPVFFLAAPGWRRYPALLRAAQEGVLPNLFAYNDPDRYPEFYDRAVLFDVSHMVSEGAERFTTTLAEDFAAWLDEQGAEKKPRRKRRKE